MGNGFFCFLIKCEYLQSYLIDTDDFNDFNMASEFG